VTVERPALEGRAAFYGPRHPARQYAAMGREALDGARAVERDQIEALLRVAVEHLVDAFLLDRGGHAWCFVEAHAIGRRLSQEFGCTLHLDEHGTWGRACGVPALHARLGLSFAGATRGRCSLCGAGDLQCDHVPGSCYGGRLCVRIVDRVDLQEISVVQFPEDPRCYRLSRRLGAEEVEAAFGGPLPRGVAPLCTHCQDCQAVERGPAPEDLDQGLWPSMQSGPP
jgi:hypothetical protein